MKILLCGADGFLGRHFEAAMGKAGHQVVRGVRQPCRPGEIALDYRQDLTEAAWLPRLEGIDAVVNAVGILNERQPEDFERIHHRAPAALFAACARRGIGRVIQVSALGAETKRTPYLASKAAADECLQALCPDGIVLQPALVFGLEGVSSRFFLALASLPFLFLPGGGRQPLRPIHIDDLAALVVGLLAAQAPAPGRVEAVGGRETSFSAMLATYRQGMGFPPALTVSLPAAAMGVLAPIGDHIPGSLFNRATWAMLKAGNTDGAGPISQFLGKPPRPPEHFIPADKARLARQEALAAWRTPLLRAILAFLWLWSAAASLFWPETGLALLAPFGLAGQGAILVLVGASALDGAFGLLTLLRPGRRLWLAQIALIAAYSLLVALRLPEFVIHPFAPIIKNLVVIALLVLLWAEEENP